MRKTLWDAERMGGDESIRLTVESLMAYGPSHKHWAVAWSGGKDSTALVTVVTWLIESGSIPAPETYTVLYADTRMELTPLWFAAQEIADCLRSRGVEVRTVMAPINLRMLPYMLGRGIPPPNNNTHRWCTRQIKIDPMQNELKRMVGDLGEKVLMLTGVRVGESAQRDAKIQMACGINGSECGQGWYQETLPDSLCDTLAPILHWRVCHVWDWLKQLAPSKRFGAWPTQIIADAYGGDEAEERNARTGCVGCPLASKDTALDGVLKLPHWEYLKPLKRLRWLYEDLRHNPNNRLRKPAGERKKDGTLAAKQCRKGPLTMDARRNGLAEVLSIQAAVNAEADRLGRPRIDILNAEEVEHIEACIASNVWPDKWTGDEPVASEPYEEGFADGTRQSLLFGN